MPSTVLRGLFLGGERDAAGRPVRVLYVGSGPGTYLRSLALDVPADSFECVSVDVARDTPGTARHFRADWEAVDPKAKGGAPATHMPGDGGMFKVGTDVAPGTYRSTGNSDGCYWERAKDAGHSIGSIIANNNVTGSAVVTISASDAYFKTTGCQDWKKTG